MISPRRRVISRRFANATFSLLCSTLLVACGGDEGTSDDAVVAGSSATGSNGGAPAAGAPSGVPSGDATSAPTTGGSATAAPTTPSGAGGTMPLAPTGGAPATATPTMQPSMGGGSSGGMPANMAGTGGMPVATGGSGGQATGGAGGGGMLPPMDGGPRGPDLTDLTALAEAPCTISSDVTTAQIPMVGVATFTTDLDAADAAIIQFGKTADYTLEAPVAWEETDHETLLLGMPANTEVHYRVVVFAGGAACVGEDATYMTGGPVMGAPPDRTPQTGPSAVEPAPGFIIAENGPFAYIINREGEVVWAYRFPGNLTRALMSWEGHYMIARELGPFNAGSGGSIWRVGMDGEGEMNLDVSGGTHHDFTVTPTGIAYPAKQAAGECDSLYTAEPDGSNSAPLVNLDVVLGKFDIGPGGAAMEECHVNAVHYYEDTDSYSISDREKDSIVFISGTGEVLGSVGAAPNAETPNHALAEGTDNMTWRVQHGHDLYEPDKLVLWTNGSFMGGQSRVLHYTIDGSTATLDWEYSGTGSSPTFSDAQHLPNGNFLATNSQSGTVHEIDPNQQLVQAFDNLSEGYTCHRTTLYGRPPGR